MSDIRTISLGEAVISIINVGNFTWTLSDKLKVAESEWRPHYTELFERPLLFPTQSIHIALPGASILVDACRCNEPSDPSAFSSNDSAPSDVISGLQQSGIQPGEITHVVLTHIHLDHYAGVTHPRDGFFVPSFPHAKHYLGQADWDSSDLQQELLDPSTPQSQTLGVLYQAGLLEMVRERSSLFHAIDIISAPGETAGHQIVRVHSQGQTLYCVGDLYHHSVEIEHSTWTVGWGDQQAKLQSRQTLLQAVLAEQALVVAAHIPLGRVVQTASALKWRPL